ncbi:MAG TPA: LCCL domain-containing protein [Nitrospira sp.]|nr:LCCL domain-containing protein [Nitrospira sp.]
MRWPFRLCAPALLLLASSPALAQQALIVADDATNAKAFRPQVGKIATFVCPAKLNSIREIWGTDVYLDESPICAAAIHAGVLMPGTSGQVTIGMGAGAQSFQGTQRNGVTSLSYGPWDSTYSFIKNNEPGQIDWYTTYDRIPDDFHSPITVLCPPKGNTDSYVWGTDIYSSSSAICVAAVHAGIITLDAGGRVTVTLQPKQDGFRGSVRNGVSTQGWTDPTYLSYPQPYKVTPGAIDVAVPTSAPAIGAGPRQAPTSGGASGPRTIRLIGFSASGTAVPIIPRTISLGGFSATGTATPIVPRSIPTSGWTGVGSMTTP